MADADLWAKITAMPRPHRLVDFPRKGPDGKPIAQVAIQVLSQQEQILAASESERFARKMLGARAGDAKHAQDDSFTGARRGYDDIYNNQAACELLFHACRKHDDLSKPFFPSPAEIREKLSPDEVGVLVRSYYLVQDEVGPIVAKMSDAEMEAWVKRLAESGTALPLASLSPDSASQLLLSMARRLNEYWTDNTSPGSPQDDGTSSTSEAPAQAEAT